MEERNLDIQNSTGNMKKQDSTEDMKREFEAIKEEWINKKINLSENNISSVAEVYTLLKDSFNFCFQSPYFVFQVVHSK